MDSTSSQLPACRPRPGTQLVPLPGRSGVLVAASTSKQLLKTLADSVKQSHDHGRSFRSMGVSGATRFRGPRKRAEYGSLGIAKNLAARPIAFKIQDWARRIRSSEGRERTGASYGSSVMRRALIAVIGLMLLISACGGEGTHGLSSHGVRVAVPAGWSRVRPAGGLVTDPATLLVVGTAGVHAKPSRCPIAAYRIPADGAVVVVVGWRSMGTAGGAAAQPGRAPLKGLIAVKRPSFDCFTGRGASAYIVLGKRPYQVNVLVGDHASKDLVGQALGVGRSFSRTDRRAQ
jgi:hypothetical protein